MRPHLPAKTIYDLDSIKAGIKDLEVSWKQPRDRPKKRSSERLSEFLTMANIRPVEVQILAID